MTAIPAGIVEQSVEMPCSGCGALVVFQLIRPVPGSGTVAYPVRLEQRCGQYVIHECQNTKTEGAAA